jgi:hypothetical protein
MGNRDAFLGQVTSYLPLLLVASMLEVRAYRKAVLWSLLSLVAVVPTVTMELVAINILFMLMVSSSLFLSYFLIVFHSFLDHSYFFRIFNYCPKYEDHSPQYWPYHTSILALPYFLIILVVLISLWYPSSLP